jgi:hypothetical protein
MGHLSAFRTRRSQLCLQWLSAIFGLLFDTAGRALCFGRFPAALAGYTIGVMPDSITQKFVLHL